MNIPGFVDLQVNGYKGVDFSSSDLTVERFQFACWELIKQGTILFLPTIISSSEEIYQQNLKLISEVIEETDLKNYIPGIHLEGPFISDVDGARGAHNPKWIKKPDSYFLDQLVEWSGGKIKLLTIAAELDGADELCRHATDLGIKVSLGHQMASQADLQRLSDSGASLLTHLGNGIPQIIDRHDNPIWAGLANDDLTAMIITDGHHLPPSLIKTILKVKGASNTIIVSDASPIAGLSPGNYSTLGNKVILKESGRLYNPETGYLVGSSSTMIDCMNYLHSLQLLNKKELLDVGFFNPLRFLKMDPDEIADRFNSRIELDEYFIFFDDSIF
ncbi:MAG: hypothetical protein U5K72_05680 [Balneolaceae bacterium]|nr:hypothetical protein [Balneolaceae bacterium]